MSFSLLWGYWFHSGKGKSLFVRRWESNAPAPHWGACGLQHQCDALRSMLSFMRGSVSSLSVVLELLPPVSSPPESDASARTLLSPLFRYCAVSTLFSLSLWTRSTRPVRSAAPRQVCDFIFPEYSEGREWEMTGWTEGAKRKRKQAGRDPVRLHAHICAPGGEGEGPELHLRSEAHLEKIIQGGERSLACSAF